MQAKAAPGKAAKAAPSQQAAAKAKEGNSNAEIAARLLSSAALTAKVLEWAPEVSPALLASLCLLQHQKFPHIATQEACTPGRVLGLQIRPSVQPKRCPVCSLSATVMCAVIKLSKCKSRDACRWLSEQQWTSVGRAGGDTAYCLPM